MQYFKITVSSLKKKTFSIEDMFKNCIIVKVTLIKECSVLPEVKSNLQS